MDQRSIEKGREKNRSIAAKGALILVAAAAIALGSIGHEPANDIAGGGGGGNTGNAVTVD